MNNLDITTLTIPTIRSLVRTNQISVVDLVEKYLDHIQAHEDQIHAFITLTPEIALDKAKLQDEQIKRDATLMDEYPLFGVPIALKDMFLTKDIRTTAGSKVLKNYIPQYSASTWRQLNHSGAILLGKLNQDAWAHGSSGENSQFGPTHNPWNLDYVPGGSSSGTAAAVAAGFTPVAMGTDTGGSIRLPASFSGVVGLKPTYGRVSRYGVVAMASSLDAIGHCTRTVEDAAYMLYVTAGKDVYDATTPDEEVPHYHMHLKLPPRKLTIGLPEEYFADGLDPEVNQLIQTAIKLLENKYDIEFVPVSLPHTKYGVAAYYIIQTSEVSSNLGRYDGIRYGAERTAFGEEAKRRIMLGTYTLSAGYYDAYYKKAMQVRTLIAQDFNKAFKNVDAILAPAAPTPAFKLGDKNQDPLQMYLGDIYTVTANLAGIPGLSVPCGFTEAGLPVGFQLLAPHFNEQTLFQIGHNYQLITDHHLQTPELE